MDRKKYLKNKVFKGKIIKTQIITCLKFYKVFELLDYDCAVQHLHVQFFQWPSDRAIEL